ncbi:dipeptidase [Arenicella xantha]|nr:dipeptidase [Arenicella xantha]
MKAESTQSDPDKQVVQVLYTLVLVLLHTTLIVYFDDMTRPQLDIPKSFIALAIMVAMACVVAPSHADPLQTNIAPEVASKVLEKYQGKEFKDFREFVFEVYLSGKVLFTRHEHHTLGDYVAHRQLSSKQQALIARMLGLYTRIKYQDEALDLLARLVSIETARTDDVAQHDNSAFVEMEQVLADVATDFGLDYRNIDGRVYEVTVPGNERGKLIGLHAHADVVPANPQEWGLDDGTELSPFTAQLIAGRVYGRGTQDDKNGIVAVLFAMRVIQQENIKLFNTMRLIVDTTEETTSTAVPYYLERNPTPDYNIALDGDYPVIIAEKGFGVVKAVFPVRPAEGLGGELVSLTGGLAYNQIPAVSRAVIEAPGAPALSDQVQQLAEQFIASYGNDFSIEVAANADRLELEVRGVSAHSSAPESGVNPVSRMLLFVHLLNGAELLKQNHITDAARYAQDNWGLDFYGKSMGIDFSDDFMGPLTAAFTKVELSNQHLEVAVNLRIPVGKPLPVLEQQVRAALGAWQKTTGTAMQLEYLSKAPMYRNPDGAWVNTLLDVASENLELAREFGSSAGGTSVHDLPNGVQFGLAMPNEKYTGHNANEFKSLKQFQLDLQIVVEMMVRLGQQQQLD